LNGVNLPELLEHLRTANRESEWVEFKLNDDEPESIGEYISALSNSATLAGKRFGYVVWGISNVTHDVVGTTVRLHDKKIGNEELENWLSHQLFPRVNFRLLEGDIGSEHVSVIEIPAASHTPVRFRDHEYIRVGSYKKKLRDHPEKQRELWRIFERMSWEKESAVTRISGAEALALVDYPSYFELLKKPLPDSRGAILAALAEDGVVEREKNDIYTVTNLGAILFARDLSKVEHLSRKAVRIVIYKDRDRTEPVREQIGKKAYANGFEGLVGYLSALLPANEQIKKALRAEVRMYPDIAIRELVANALIHQDFRITGAGPMIEVFSDRIEISNPGTPLIDTKRFLDASPQSRNEKLAALMRRMNICEERGSGIDKVIKAVEVFQLPPPRFDVSLQSTKATLFAPRKLSAMDKDDRVRACYQHAGLRYISGDYMTNTSLRERFGIAAQNYSSASRIIGETTNAGLIKKADPESKSKKHARYVPFWS
jgi:ATP-dependent DNA helicase RecG